MRILQVIATIAPRDGGPTTAVLGLGAALSRVGHECLIATTDGDGTARLSVPCGRPVQYRGATVIFFKRTWPKSYGMSCGLAKFLLREIPNQDFVHIHSIYLMHSFLAATICRIFRVPYCIRPHGTLTEYHRSRGRAKKFVYWHLLQRHDLNRACFVHYTSAREAADAVSLGLRSTAVIQPLGIVLPLGAWTPTLARDSSDIRIAFVGRIQAKKNLPELVKAVAHLRDQDCSVSLAVAGPEEDDSARVARCLAEQLGVEEAVAFMGVITPADRDVILRRADVFVLPSEEENFGHAVLEACALGVSCVISQGVALSSQLVHLGNVRVVPVQYEAIANAIGELYGRSPQDKAAAAAEQRSYVAANYEWDRVARSLGVIYQGCVQK